MTTPDSSPPDTVASWQAQLLLRIRMLAAEHTRVRNAGYEITEDPDHNVEHRVAYLAHLDKLEAERELAEQTALSAGLDPTWIEDMRELGGRDAPPPIRSATRHAPARDNAAQQMYVDMLGLDLWHLERMASLSAARADRIATGRWSFGADPLAEQRFARNMTARHQRVTALAHAAEITPAEAETLWGADAEGARRAHAVFVETYDELSVVAEWNSYAIASPDLAIPPYLPADSATATPTTGAHASPPTPRQMIDAASASLRARFVDAALSDSGVVEDHTAITTAIEAALPDGAAAALPVGETVEAGELDYPTDSTEPGLATDFGTEI
ncbi:hypothetical protein ACFYT3_09910 [Nocardia amikacinitolerans]|uniref:hypothetical protein n=1 Tax=Nocardia amikacinitolerans TaxID=756689 RepID=UPI0036BC45A3